MKRTLLFLWICLSLGCGDGEGGPYTQAVVLPPAPPAVRVFNGENLRVDNRSGVEQDLFIDGLRVATIGVGERNLFRVVDGMYEVELREAGTQVFVFKAEFFFRSGMLLSFRHEDPTTPSTNFEVNNFSPQRLKVFLNAVEVADLGSGSNARLLRPDGLEALAFQEEGQAGLAQFGSLQFSRGTAFYLEYR